MKTEIVKQENRNGVILTSVLIDRGEPSFYSLQSKWINGYLTFTKDHPLYGKNYDDIDIDVHGGLTYSDETKADGHIKAEGWTIGFDTMHLNDDIEMQDSEYVWNEIESMYKQITEGKNNEQV